MVIRGVWELCDDGFIRPVFRAEVLAAGGTWVEAPFLVDTGADRTVFSADVLRALHLEPLPSANPIGGVGGVASSVLIPTQIVFFREDGIRVTFRGQYAAFTEVNSLDISVLGRDITNLFAIIVDWPNSLVSLVGDGHEYTIQTKPTEPAG